MPDEEQFDAAEFVEWMLDVPTEEAVAELRVLPYDEFREAFREWNRTWEPVVGRAFYHPELRPTTLRAVRDALGSLDWQLRRDRDEGQPDPDWTRRARKAKNELTRARESLERQIAAAAKAGDDPVAAVAAYEEEVIALRAQVERLQASNSELNERAQEVDSLRKQTISLNRKVSELQRHAGETGGGQEIAALRKENRSLRQGNEALRRENVRLSESVEEPVRKVDTSDLAHFTWEQLAERVRLLQRRNEMLKNRALKAEQGQSKKRRR